MHYFILFYFFFISPTTLAQNQINLKSNMRRETKSIQNVYLLFLSDFIMQRASEREKNNTK